MADSMPDLRTGQVAQAGSFGKDCQGVKAKDVVRGDYMSSRDL